MIIISLLYFKVSQKFGVAESEIHAAIESDDPQNQLMIAYNLVIDNKRFQMAKEAKDFKELLAGQKHSSSTSSLGHLDSTTPRPHPERIAPLRDIPHVEKTHRGAPIKRNKWHLGIRSQSKPPQIMMEVYKAMKTLDFEWSTTDCYHVQV